MADYLSVGIDIGTSTTQLVFSSFEMENTAAYFSVPKVSVVNKQIVYMSPIYDTPMRDTQNIDAAEVERIVAAEYAKAGRTAGEVDTGAVIITGETARKDNASQVLEALSGYAGDFVVATAGPDLEAIIAGKGSGACEYSSRYMCTVMNIDIGGGTSNAAFFDNGETVACGSLDIGGRLVTYNSDGVIGHISDGARKVAVRYGIDVAVGRRADDSQLVGMAEGMAKVLEQFAGLRAKDALFYDLQTPGGSVFDLQQKPDAVFFSGGVADCVYNDIQDKKRYGDIGVYLGAALRSDAFAAVNVARPAQTIRATVVGAGSYTVSVSGSTVLYAGDVFPMKNVPVLKLDEHIEQAIYRGNSAPLKDRAKWFVGQNDGSVPAFAIKGRQDPSYNELTSAAVCLIDCADAALPDGAPLIVTMQADMAKALGQAIKTRMDRPRSIICLDGVEAGDSDYMDFGHPLMEGLVVPVGVKTLIFGG